MVRRHADRLRRIAILAALAQRATSERAREIMEDIEALAQGRRPRNRDRYRLATEAAFLTAKSLAAAAEEDWERCARLSAEAAMAVDELKAMPEITTEEMTAVAVPRRNG